MDDVSPVVIPNLADNLVLKWWTSEHFPSAPGVQRKAAQRQQEKHDDVQNLWGLCHPTLANLVRRHVLNDRDKVRPQKHVENCQAPVETRHKWVGKATRPGQGSPHPPSDCEQVIQTGWGHDRPVENITDSIQDLNQQTNVISVEP